MHPVPIFALCWSTLTLIYSYKQRNCDCLSCGCRMPNRCVVSFEYTWIAVNCVIGRLMQSCQDVLDAREAERQAELLKQLRQQQEAIRLQVHFISQVCALKEISRALVVLVSFFLLLSEFAALTERGRRKSCTRC